MNDTTTTRCEALPWNDANAQRMLDWQPGDAEAAAAIEGMQETYGGLHGGHTKLVAGQLVTTWNVGERVKFRDEDHGELSGTIIEVLVEDGDLSQYHIAAHVPGKGRQHFAVLNRDLLIF